MQKFPKISIGAAQFGMTYSIGASSKLKNKDIKKILSYATEMGITSIDTAPAYGSSEKILGEIGVSKWEITSKLPQVPHNCVNIKSWVLAETKKILKNLKVDYLEALLLHRPNQLLSPLGGEIYSALEDLKDGGYIKKHGISSYGTEEISQCHKSYNLDIFQSPLNLLDRNLIESGTAADLKKSAKIIQARSIFLQGLLILSSHQKSKKFQRWSPLWDQLQKWLNKKNISPIQACISYVYSLSEIDTVIIGVLNYTQLKEILESIITAEFNFPAFSIDEKDLLINPSNWDKL